MADSGEKPRLSDFSFSCLAQHGEYISVERKHFDTWWCGVDFKPPFVQILPTIKSKTEILTWRRPECLAHGTKYSPIQWGYRSLVLPHLKYWKCYLEAVNRSRSMLPQVIEFTQSKFTTLLEFNGPVPAERTQQLVFGILSLTFCCHLVVFIGHCRPPSPNKSCYYPSMTWALVNYYWAFTNIITFE